MRIDTFEGQTKRLLFWEDGDNSEKVKKYMIKKKLTGMCFSKWLGFQGNEIIIDNTFEFVDEVNIIDSNISDISFIYKFPNVKKLNIQNMDRTQIDFNHFKALEELFLTWRKGITNLFSKRSLRILKLDRFKEKTLEIDIDSLEELWMINSSIKNLSILSSLKNLEFLKLGYLPNLEDSSWIKRLENLEGLEIESCKKLSSTILNDISELFCLRELFISKAGDIPTLKPIENLKNLEVVSFIENSKILDGDFIPLSKLPNLKEIHPSGLNILLQQQLKKKN